MGESRPSAMHLSGRDFLEVSVGVGSLQGSRRKGGCCGSDRAICL